jgi:two-component system phosphate regulon sensor histidine kinase PhoR
MSRGPRSKTKLSSRFLSYYALTFLVLIGLMGLIVDRTTRSALIEDAENSLAMASSLAWESLPQDPAEYEEWAGRAFEAGGFRTTLIRSDGVVLADSHLDASGMENHGGRAEVLLAMAGEVGVATRVSASTGSEQLYVALPPRDGLIVRSSIPTRVLGRELGVIRETIVLTAGALGLLGIGVVALLARRMAKPITELTAQARALLHGDETPLPRRSQVRELDQLGLAISALAIQLGSRVSDAEEAIETLEVVLGALPQGTILVDKDDRIAYANPSAYAILGAVPNQLSGLAPLPFQNAIRAARQSREQEIRVLDHGNPARRLRGVATPFTGDERVLLLLVDITERERTDSIRRDFVANASHELKTPVSTIIASSEALQISLDRGDEAAAGFARRIEDSARQLDRLVGDLLDLSRLEKEHPDMGPVRLDLLISDEVERVRHLAQERDLDVDVTVEQVTVMASHRDVAIALRNLLDNAMRYTMAGGSVLVAVTAVGDEAIVSVADTGEGIPTRDIQRVFERFYRVDSARSRATGGTGLGLSIVKHVAESHGGTVSVVSELGVGSTFVITLPMTPQGEGPGAN